MLASNRERLRALGVERTGLFGSFRRGEPSAGSDEDFLVEIEPGQKTFDTLRQLSFLESTLGRRAELVTTASLSPYIGPGILNEAEYVELAA